MRMRATPLFRSSILALCLAMSGCAPSSSTNFIFDEARHQFTAAEKETIEQIARRAIDEARASLPGVPPAVTIRIGSSKNVIPETGESGSSSGDASLYWVVDPAHPGGIAAVAQSWLRPSLLHEMHHLVRFARLGSHSLLDLSIAEGLATLYEEEQTSVRPPWGNYDINVIERWTEEFLKLPDTAPRDPWMTRHPDGRRWIGYRVGAYVGRRAERELGQSAAQMVVLPTERIIDASGVKTTTDDEPGLSTK